MNVEGVSNKQRALAKRVIEIEEITIKVVDNDSKLIDRISLERGIPRKRVDEILRYNVLTVQQLNDLTGKSVSTIQNLIRPRYVGGKMVIGLNKCYPFAVADDKKGFLFIHRNENCERFISDSLR